MIVAVYAKDKFTQHMVNLSHMEQAHSIRKHKHIPDEGDFVSEKWETTEYYHSPKSKDWYWGLSMITVTILIISFLLGDGLFGIFTLIAAFTLALFAHQPPRLVTVELTTKGIALSKTFYPYSEMESFWVDIIENPNHPKILFKSKRLLMPFIAIPLGNMHPDDIADFLIDYLPEVHHKEPLLMRLLEDFGF
jgi:hypothetical protein